MTDQETVVVGDTRAQRKIRRAVEAAGGEIEQMAWEPIRRGPEKSGPSGGWLVWLKGGGHVLGYSADEVVRSIEEFGL